MRGTPDLRATAVAVALAGCGVALVACDPPPAEDILLGPSHVEPFAVERISPDRGPVAADDAIVVRFTQELDPSSIGVKSVRVSRPDGRHLVKVRAAAGGRELRVSPLPGRAFPVGETLLLRIDGAPSVRALRSASGEALPERFTATFRTGPRRTDLRGPVLVESKPADGAADVVAGPTVELRFDEPLARGSVRSGDAVVLRVDGAVVPARLDLSVDATLLIVRPVAPIAPDRSVEVEVRDSLLDAAGNPVDRASAPTIRFRTSAESIHELVEDFVDAANADAPATSCGWDDAESPGALVARSGVLRVAADAGVAGIDLGEEASVHFQLLLSAGDVPAGLASAMRVEFASAPPGAHVTSAHVEAGPAWIGVREPSFAANRGSAELRTVARTSDATAIEPASGAGDLAFADVPFEEPLRLARGRAVLLDVTLTLSAGVHLAAFPDDAMSALFEGHGGVAPAVSLVVTPSTPQARSLWYDTGVSFPGWRTPSVELVSGGPGVTVLAEFQSAPADRDGGADALRASPWESDLTRLPAYRFVRFRLRFEGAAGGDESPRIDRIVLPYER